MSEAPGRVEAVGGFFIWCHMAVSEINYDDVDLPAINRLISACFWLDMIGLMVGPKPRKFCDEPRLFPERGQMVPIDRVYIARMIRNRYGPDVAGCVMDNHYIFRLH
jgi:hypothetical protein